MLSKPEAEQYIQDHRLGSEEYSSEIVIPENTIKLNFGWIIYYHSKSTVDEFRNKCGLGSSILDAYGGGEPLYIIDSKTKEILSVGWNQKIEDIILNHQKKMGYDQKIPTLEFKTNIYKLSPLEHKMWMLCYGMKAYPSLKEAGYSAFFDFKIIRSLWNILAKLFFRPICRIICKLKKKNGE